MHLTMKSLVVIVLVALLLAVTLVVLLIPSTSWAAALEWFMNSPQSAPCDCIPGGD